MSSSYSVYGQPDAYPVAESAAKQPTTAHGHAALFTEGAVELYAAKKPFFNALLLRHGSVMGTDPHARIGEQLAASKHGEVLLKQPSQLL